MKLTLILLCMIAILSIVGCKSTDPVNGSEKTTANKASTEGLCNTNTGSRLKKKC